MSTSSNEMKDIVKSNCSSSSSKKNDSINSMTSSNLKVRMLQRKSQCRPAGFFSGSTNGLNSDIRQRVVSARQHRYKNLQSQLNMVLQHNAELINENRLLKTLYKRQDNALAKYEGTTSELPQLINSHTEELRVWQTKYRTLNLQNRDLNKKIQQKDKMLNELSDRVKYLTILTSERHLEERDVLSTKLNSLEKILVEKDEELKMLTRKNAIEAKNFRTQLANEKKKYKELCQKQNSNCDKQNVSSNDSDYSSAKDVKELKHIVSSLSTVSAISEETPPSDMNVNIGADDNDDDDNDELVIKRIDKDVSINNHDSQQLIQQLADINLFANDESTNIHAIQKKIQRDIEKNEAFLDLHCDEISRDINGLTSPRQTHLFDAVGENGIHRKSENNAMSGLLMIKSNRSDDSKGSLLINSSQSRAPRTTSCLPRFNINVGGKPLKRTPIDPQKKSKLLAQLKSIGSANSGL